MTWNDLSRFRRELMGAACLWILMGHNLFRWSEPWINVKRFFSWGNCGVDLFLLLSGIGLYFAYHGREGELGRFYRRRFVRLLVPYLLLHGPYYIWYCLRNHENYLLYLSQAALPLRGVQTSWYIAASAVFYLLFPLIYHLQKEIPARTGRLSRHTVTLLLCMISLAVCRLLMTAAPVFYERTEILLTRLPVFLMGCDLGEAVMEKRGIPRTAVWAGIAFVWLLIYQFYPENGMPTFWIRMVMIPLALGMILGLTALLRCLGERNWFRVFLRFFGDHSIEIYLTHMVFLKLWWAYLSERPILENLIPDYLMILAVSIAVSAAVHPLIGGISHSLLKNAEGGEK